MTRTLPIDPAEIKLSDPKLTQARLRFAEAQAAHLLKLKRIREKYEGWQNTAIKRLSFAELDDATLAALKIKYDSFDTRTTTAKSIILEIARKHHVTTTQILGDRKFKKIAFARQEAAYEIKRRLPHMSLPQIAANLGNRDHTTILHAIRAHAARNALPLLLLSGSGLGEPA